RDRDRVTVRIVPLVERGRGRDDVDPLTPGFVRQGRQPIRPLVRGPVEGPGVRVQGPQVRPVGQRQGGLHGLGRTVEDELLVGVRRGGLRHPYHSLDVGHGVLYLADAMIPAPGRMRAKAAVPPAALDSSTRAIPTAMPREFMGVALAASMPCTTPPMRQSQMPTYSPSTRPAAIMRNPRMILNIVWFLPSLIILHPVGMRVNHKSFDRIHEVVGHVARVRGEVVLARLVDAANVVHVPLLVHQRVVRLGHDRARSERQVHRSPFPYTCSTIPQISRGVSRFALAMFPQSRASAALIFFTPFSYSARHTCQHVSCRTPSGAPTSRNRRARSVSSSLTSFQSRSKDSGAPWGRAISRANAMTWFVM